jgi:hypothetical protein
MRRTFASLLLLTGLVASAEAVTVVPLRFDQLVHASAAIVVGRVTHVRGEFISGGRGIESIVTIEVMKGLKGSAGETAQFTVPGGRAGRYLNLIPGAPTFAEGDLAVVFLTARGARLPVTTGLTQGVYRMHTFGGQLMVMPPAISTLTTHTRGAAARKPVTLEAFEASIKSVMAAK